jgi:hypothetical protein
MAGIVVSSKKSQAMVTLAGCFFAVKPAIRIDPILAPGRRWRSGLQGATFFE